MIYLDIRNKLISNTTLLSLNYFFNTLLYIFFWILLGKTLNVDSYGKIALAMQITTFFDLLSLVGLGTTLKKIIPEFIQRKKEKRIDNLISFSIVVTTTASFAFSIILILFSVLFPNALKLSQDFLLLVVLAILANTFSDILSAIYYGYQDMKMILVSTCAGNLLMIILTFISIRMGLDYVGVILAFIASFLVMALMRFRRAFVKYPWKIVYEKDIVRQYAIPTFLVVVLLVLFNNTHYIILSSLKGTETTGIFAVSMKITSMVTLVPTIFASALLPITSGLSVDKNNKKKQEFLVWLVFRYSAFIIFPMAMLMMAFPKTLILFFSTSEFLPAIELLPIMAIAGTILGLSGPLVSTLYGLGEPKKYRNSYLISTLVYVSSALVLTYYFDAMGMAVSYLISSISFFILGFHFIRQSLGMSFPFKMVGKIMFAVLIAYLFLNTVRPYVDNIVTMGMFSGIAGIIYLMVLLVSRFYIKEDLKVMDYLTERLPILKKEMAFFRKQLLKFIAK